MNRLSLPIAILIMPLLAGCLSLAPDYERPDTPAPSKWPDGPAYPDGETGTNAPAAADLAWQVFFADDELRRVIAMALDNNRDLRLAVLNVERARSLYGVQRAELFPALDAAGAWSKQLSSVDLVGSDSPRTTESYSVDLGMASWEIDFFGRIRSLKDRALQNYLATEAARRGAQVALVAEVATAYLTLASDRDTLALAHSTLELRRETYRLIERQYDASLATEIDLRRARSQVDAARVSVALYTRRVALAGNALDLLAGAPVPEALVPESMAEISPPADIAAGLTSDVLLNRPDIMAAEHRLKGANAFIGAARAAFFPRIGLTAAIGTASDELSGLFGAGTDTWSFSPRIAMPVFDSRVRAAHRVSKVDQEIALVQYEKTIQEAFREVADALANRGTLHEQISAQAALVESARTIHALAERRFNNGIDSYLSVLDAQRSLYAAEQDLLAVRLADLASRIRLYAVLGGGTRADVDERQDRVEHSENPGSERR